MIKFLGSDKESGDWVVGLGLSDGNIKLLRQGRPISVDLKQMGLPAGKVAILWGRTEAAILAELKELGMVVHETEIRDQAEEHEQT